jgi:pyruvate ferredoxin oxidoreductase beta subunit
MRATKAKLIAANATGCLEVFSTPYPETSWQLPWIHSLFGNAAAVGTGIAAALKVKARKAGKTQSDVRVIAQGR